MFAVTLMYFSNVTLNVISLAGLALGVGMLVDNSIVVIENIYRLRNTGLSPAKAAVEGAKQVSGAIIASTLTTVCVFLAHRVYRRVIPAAFCRYGADHRIQSCLPVYWWLLPWCLLWVPDCLIRTKVKEHRIFNKILSVYEKSIKLCITQRNPLFYTCDTFVGFKHLWCYHNYGNCIHAGGGFSSAQQLCLQSLTVRAEKICIV
jgi:Cu/Ag efflux pump CusA